MRLDPITVRIVQHVRAGSSSSRLARSLSRMPCFFHPYWPCCCIPRMVCRLPGGYSNLEPLLPIPNRTVKRVCADDSVHSHAKVGHRQTNPRSPIPRGIGLFCLQILTFTPSNFMSWKDCGATATMKLSLSPERASAALRALINHVILPATKKISGHL